MSETLLAILFVTSSAKGSSLVYRWPPLPKASPRLVRPKPRDDLICTHADNPWRAANMLDSIPEATQPCGKRDTSYDDEDYYWRRPNVLRDRSLSFSHSHSHPASRRASPSKDPGDSFTLDGPRNQLPADSEYFEVLGYEAEFLAGLLCPQRAMCHQKFELIVDNLAFIGHPVCAEPDGQWQFKPVQTKMPPRGRGSKKGQSPQQIDDKSLTPEKQSSVKRPAPDNSWLQTFHLVLVLDLPDPSSSASGNIAKYFDTIYEQIAFIFTAVLYQEQVLSNFVEGECDALGTLENDYIANGESFADYMSEALKVSSIAPAMKTLYEAIKGNTIARIVIHDFPLELQLPPYLDELLHNDDLSDTVMEPEDKDEFESDGAPWGADMTFAWKLPALAPWKALLRLDEHSEQSYELYMKLRGPQLTAQDRELASQLIKFLDFASITLNLADLANLLDWDIETQVYPTVRWLVHHRRAKLVDAVHGSLKTVFTIPSTLPGSLADLSADFARAFTHPSVPPLPKLLSMITTTTYDQTGNHFYASVVRSKELVPLYMEVVIWLLKRDLLVTLHLRIRVVATPELKLRAFERRKALLAGRGKSYDMAKSGKEEEDIATGEQGQRKEENFANFGAKDENNQAAAQEGSVTESSPVEFWLSMSPKSARRQTRQMSPTVQRGRTERSSSNKSDKHLLEDKVEDVEEDEEDEDGIDVGMLENWGDGLPSMISDPGRATPVEREWLATMSEGKDPDLKRRFEQINPYFNGKCTDDEILYKADITRKQLREVLHHYDEYLQTFLHPA